MKKPTIYITRKLPEQIISPYRDRFTILMWEEEDIPVPKDVLIEKSQQADGIFTNLTDQIDEHFIKENPQLKLIANLAVGYDNIDVGSANKHGIIVTNTPDVLTETTADLSFALLLATSRRLLEAEKVIRNNLWKDWSPYFLAGKDIHHKTIGIVGMGRIGEAVAKRAKGFNMSVLYHNRNRKPKVEEPLGATYVSFTELLQQADFVVSLVPLSAETKQLFNRDAFQTMKSEAIFINISRGGVVDEQALYDALKTGEIKAAGLDVFANEPITKDHPLLTLNNCVCLPHIGSASMETRTAMIQLCLKNIDNYFYGDGPLTPVTKN